MWKQHIEICVNINITLTQHQYNIYHITLILSQDGLMAEIPIFPPSWRITFKLKLTGKPRQCCSQCSNGIIHVKGGDNPWLDLYVLKISYRCAPPSQTHAPEMVVVLWGGVVFHRERRQELLLGEWTSFEISQTRENYKNKERLMFKVTISEYIIFIAHELFFSDAIASPSTYPGL